MVTLKNIKLRLQDKIILHDISAHLPQGKITVFVGKSGAGKTSLFKCMVHLLTEYEGTIVYQNKSLKKLSAKQRAQMVGFVFQQFHLFPHMTVLQNCVQPQIGILGQDTVKAKSKALLLLEKFGLQELVQSYPHQLSGGQQQRVAIARALCLNPNILLFDEPSSSLDPQTTHELALLLKELSQQGVTIGVCSHDMPFVKEVFDKAYLLEQGMVVDHYQGMLNQIPSNQPLARFLGKN